MRVALTGSTGFIGRTLVDLLVQSGHTVVAHRRRPPATPTLRIEVISGDLTHPEVWSRLTKGCDCVVHLAGVVRGLSRADFSFHVESVRAALLGAAAVPLLMVSSLAAREPHLSHYAASKREAEDELKASAKRDWTILRPTAVYGPHDQEIKPLLDLMRVGLFPYLGPRSPSNKVTLVHVTDLCELITNWVDAPRAFGQLIEVSDDRPDGYSWFEIHAAVQPSAWRRAMTFPLPTSLLRGVAILNETLGRVTRRAPMLTRQKLNELTFPSWRCDLRAATVQLRYAPRMTLPLGLASLERQ